MDTNHKLNSASNYQHIPVLLNETLAPLLENHGSVYVDCTLGGGGHLSVLMNKKPEAKFVAFDRDLSMIEQAKIKFADELTRGRLTLVHSNYGEIRQRLSELGILKVDGIILDAGVSSFQLDIPERGFSFQKDGPLDMRMDQTNPVSAYNVVNEWGKAELEYAFFTYGEEKFTRKIVSRIIDARSAKPIETTMELSKLIESAIPRSSVGQGPHPATRVFQAIRIAVNKELEGLEQFLKDVPYILAPNGVASVISFHSLEDRLVKDRFKELSAPCLCPPEILTCARCNKPPGENITKKPILANEQEISVNPRSRSAKLRVFKRNDNEIVKSWVEQSGKR